MTVLNQAAGAQLDVSAIQRAINDLQTQATSLSLGGVQVLAKSAVAVSCPADTSEDTLATITIPAGAMGPNGLVRIHTRWSWTNGASNKTVRVRFSGAAGTVYTTGSVTTNNGAALLTEIANRNSAASQVGSVILEGSIGFSAQPVVTSSVDTTVATTVAITGQKASAGDALTLESYLVELVYGG